MKAEWLLIGALFALPLNRQQTPANPVTARDYYNELNAANEFKTYSDEYVCFYEDDVPSFLVAAKGEDVLQLTESNGEKISKELTAVKGHLFYKTYYKGVLSGGLEEMPPVRDTIGYSTVNYRVTLTQHTGKVPLTITYSINWSTGRIRMIVETGTVGSRNYSMQDRSGKCEFIHPQTAVLLDQTIPKELRENRCFQSKSAEERKRFLGEVSAMPQADFEKTMKDMSVINASDRLTGAKGCETSKAGQ